MTENIIIDKDGNGMNGADVISGTADGNLESWLSSLGEYYILTSFCMYIVYL